MNQGSNYNVNLSFKSTVTFLAIVLMLLFSAVCICHAQTDSANATTQVVADTVSKGKINNSMKMVFSEIKKGGEDNMFVTIGMIVGVLAIVGIAMYISFREPGPKKA